VKLPFIGGAAATAGALLCAGTATACTRGSSTSTLGSVVPPEDLGAGIDLPGVGSGFGNPYAQYVKQYLGSQDINAPPIGNSQNDVTKLVANVQAPGNTGARAVVMAPRDIGANAPALG
jgi:simple sugar transport system substrate-binding protein/ribose transport system substrate-binding protein